MCGREHVRGETVVPGCIERGWRSSSADAYTT
jgi:hypothetical protein